MSDGPNGEASMPFRLPPMGTPYVGKPITQELLDLFSPWGRVTGIIVADNRGLDVSFDGGMLIRFIPASVQFG